MDNDIFKFRDNGEDDGSREYDNEGYCLCNRCRTRMMFWEDMDLNVSYYKCPKCGFIEIDEYYDDGDSDEYDEYYDAFIPDDELDDDE